MTTRDTITHSGIFLGVVIDARHKSDRRGHAETLDIKYELRNRCIANLLVERCKSPFLVVKLLKSRNLKCFSSINCPYTVKSIITRKVHGSWAAWCSGKVLICLVSARLGETERFGISNAMST